MTFTHFATVCHRIEETSSRLAMTELVADLLQQSTLEEIGKICYLLQGRVVPLYEAREFGIADKFMIRAIALAYSIELSEVEKSYRAQGDLGIAACEFAPNNTSPLTLLEVYEKLYELTTINGEGAQEQKIFALAELLKTLDPMSVRLAVRIPLGKLRLGFSDMTILDALSWMLTGDKSERELLEAAYNVRPDIGYIAMTVKEKGMDGLRSITSVVGVPIFSCLCQRLPTAAEMVEKMGTVSVEPKYDGVRVQIHYKKLPSGKMEIKTFSRNLEETTDMFPELMAIEQYISADTVILDAEAVGVHPVTGEILPFQETTTRKRKHAIAQAAIDVPLQFFVFDIIYLNGNSLLTVPLSQRREKLQEILKKNKVMILSPHIVTSNPEEILAYHKEQRSKGLEGIVVKKWDSPYEPGRRRFTWVKLKETEGKTGKLADTIDAVVMGYYYGEGKRNSFGIGAFLVGIRSGETILTTSKIGTGVVDEQWKELKEKFEQYIVTDKPKEYRVVDKTLIPHVWISPAIVVEIAGDDLTRSKTHTAGYAVRFPRLIKVREDKSADTITTLQEITDLFNNQ